MKPRHYLPLLITMLCTVLLPGALCQETPKTMTKISVRLIEPAPEPRSFAAQPRTIWRVGVKYARIAEALDFENHVHGLTIINEPDVWMVNLVDKSGKHVVDSGPVMEVHLPIFQTSSEAKTKLHELEFGGESAFFASNGATVSPGEVLKGKPTERHELSMGGRKLILWTDAVSKKPVRISMSQGTQVQAFEYVNYEDGLAFDPALFQPPATIAIGNAR
jgi:hypothetical protein